MESNAISNVDLRALIQAELESITASMSQLSKLCIPLCIHQIKALSSDIFPQIIKDNILQSVYAVSIVQAEVLPLLTERMKELIAAYTRSESTVEIPEETLESIRKLEPLVPEKDRESFEDIIAPSQAGKGKFLTFEKFCALVSLIASIVTIIYYSYDFSLKVAESKQQQAEDDQLQKIVDLREAELELAHEFLEYVKENEIFFPGQSDRFVEQANPFGEQTNELIDLGETDRHPDKDNQSESIHDPQE